MKIINGEWIMLECFENDPDCLRTPDDPVYLVHHIGFLPLFSNSVSGFSVEGAFADRKLVANSDGTLETSLREEIKSNIQILLNI